MLVTSRYGLNHVALEVADAAGNVRHGLCTFLVADQFVAESAPLADVTLRLGQAAIDDGLRVGFPDGTRVRPFNSLADIIDIVLGSEGLHTVLDKGLQLANPLMDGFFQVDDASFTLPGNKVGASLVDGGVQVHVRFVNPQVRLRVTTGVPPHRGPHQRR